MIVIAASITNQKLAFYASSTAEVTRVRVFDRQGRLLQEIDEGIWVGTTFYLRPPLARELGVPGVVLAEPLRVQLERGETPADGEWTLARIRVRWLDRESRPAARSENGRTTGVATE